MKHGEIIAATTLVQENKNKKTTHKHTESFLHDFTGLTFPGDSNLNHSYYFYNFKPKPKFKN